MRIMTARQTRCAPSPHWGEGWGEGVTDLSIDRNPSPPLPMGEGAHRARRRAIDSNKGADRGMFNKLQAMTAFARVAELESFSAAVEKLGISPSAVTKLVARLEQELGARLLNRTTRRLSLTEQGRDFYQRCVRILAELDDAEAAMLEANRAPRGTVRAAIPISFSRVTVIPALPEFYARYPDVKVEIVSTDRPVDLIEDGFDVAISGRAGADTPAGLVRRLLIRSSFVTVASPKYLAAHGVPSEPTDLMRHNCIL